jgi:hypothetical protein
MEKTQFFNAFKERMGKSDNPNMQFNLQDIMGEGLNEETRNALEAPFTNKEIEDVVKDLPNYKSPRPDGFNNEFIKKTAGKLLVMMSKHLLRIFPMEIYYLRT